MHAASTGMWPLPLWAVIALAALDAAAASVLFLHGRRLQNLATRAARATELSELAVTERGIERSWVRARRWMVLACVGVTALLVTEVVACVTLGWPH